jgi:hypothetical protein
MLSCASRHVRASDLWDRYATWCKEAGLPRRSRQSFSQGLRAVGFRSWKSNGRMIYEAPRHPPAPRLLLDQQP